MSVAEEFAECCGYQRWFVDEGWISLQTAADNLQLLAECAGYVEDLGQDSVQKIMADAFAPAEDLPLDYASHLVMSWEVADSRDRWKWTGELPPPAQASPAEKPKRETSQSTVDAFRFVLSLRDPKRVRAWLRDHTDDAPALLAMLEAA